MFRTFSHNKLGREGVKPVLRDCFAKTQGTKILSLTLWYYQLVNLCKKIDIDKYNILFIIRLRIVMHLKSVKYACKYALKTAKIFTEN